jgi:hypothetical protein
MKLEFSRHILKNPQISNFMKIRPVGAELYHADGWRDGRTDRHDEASSHPSQICESANNDTKILKYKGYIFTAWSQVLVWEIEGETKTSQTHRALWSPQEYQKASEQTYPQELTQLLQLLDNSFFQKLMQ